MEGPQQLGNKPAAPRAQRVVEGVARTVGKLVFGGKPVGLSRLLAPVPGRKNVTARHLQSGCMLAEVFPPQTSTFYQHTISCLSRPSLEIDVLLNVVVQSIYGVALPSETHPS